MKCFKKNLIEQNFILSSEANGRWCLGRSLSPETFTKCHKIVHFANNITQEFQHLCGKKLLTEENICIKTVVLTHCSIVFTPLLLNNEIIDGKCSPLNCFEDIQLLRIWFCVSHSLLVTVSFTDIQYTS